MSKDEMQQVTVRIANGTDAEKMLEIYEPYVKKTAITFEYDVPTAAQFTERFQTITA